ncbi:GTPase ObgE [Candidatus Neomarinimicrobiota bacterium]
MFLDFTKISVRAGNGGHGMIAFRRERYLPKGGPAGGDGGKGGDVILQVDPQLSTLHDVSYHRSYKAGRGGHGSGANKEGANGKDVILRVPQGTVVKNAETEEFIIDLLEDNQEHVIARGGQGGFGNAHFKSARHQAPREATDGGEGEEMELALELKVLADVGLVGFPNAGKSTLLARLSAAHPKIADYPFTTMQPHLGIVKYGDYKTFVMADIPGLIEGASAGKGLGFQFLRHIERTRLLVYMIDGTAGQPVEEQFQVLRGELATYAEALVNRPSLIVLTKSDAWVEPPDRDELDKVGASIHEVSAVTGAGVDKLVFAIGHELKAIETDPA